MCVWSCLGRWGVSTLEFVKIGNQEMGGQCVDVVDDVDIVDVVDVVDRGTHRIEVYGAPLIVDGRPPLGMGSSDGGTHTSSSPPRPTHRHQLLTLVALLTLLILLTL